MCAYEREREIVRACVRDHPARVVPACSEQSAALAASWSTIRIQSAKPFYQTDTKKSPAFVSPALRFLQHYRLGIYMPYSQGSLPFLMILTVGCLVQVSVGRELLGWAGRAWPAV